MKSIELCFSVCIAFVASMSNAGPLDPPSGPVEPTMKSLDEVEPRIAINETNTPGDADSMFRITVPGSYYLTSGFFVVPLIDGDEIGIEVAADDVTIDLGGFVITGTEKTTSGIAVDGNTWSGLTVINGAITGFDDGIAMLPGNEYATIRDVRVSGNRARGIDAGRYAHVERCNAFGNGTIGIDVGGGSRVYACTSTTNDGAGIYADSYSIVRDNFVRENSGRGIRAVGGCMVEDNLVRENGFDITEGMGIQLDGFQNRVQGNHVNLNAFAIKSIGENLIVHNTIGGENLLSGDVSGFAYQFNDQYGIVETYWLNYFLED